MAPAEASSVAGSGVAIASDLTLSIAPIVTLSMVMNELPRTPTLATGTSETNPKKGNNRDRLSPVKALSPVDNRNSPSESAPIAQTTDCPTFAPKARVPAGRAMAMWWTLESVLPVLGGEMNSPNLLIKNPEVKPKRKIGTNESKST